jgi:hypothetical protein
MNQSWSIGQEVSGNILGILDRICQESIVVYWIRNIKNQSDL